VKTVNYKLQTTKFKNYSNGTYEFENMKARARFVVF
jgi:hypothetical protein